MPGWFKQHGYFVHGMGKLYHPGLPPKDDGELSWSDPSRYSQSGETPLLPGQSPDAALLGGDGDDDWEAAMEKAGCLTGEPGGSYCEINGTKGPDDTLMEAGVASMKMLANWSKTSGERIC